MHASRFEVCARRPSLKEDAKSFLIGFEFHVVIKSHVIRVMSVPAQVMSVFMGQHKQTASKHREHPGNIVLHVLCIDNLQECLVNRLATPHAPDHCNLLDDVLM